MILDKYIAEFCGVELDGGVILADGHVVFNVKHGEVNVFHTTIASAAIADNEGRVWNISDVDYPQLVDLLWDEVSDKLIDLCAREYDSWRQASMPDPDAAYEEMKLRDM